MGCRSTHPPVYDYEYIYVHIQSSPARLDPRTIITITFTSTTLTPLPTIQTHPMAIYPCRDKKQLETNTITTTITIPTN